MINHAFISTGTYLEPYSYGEVWAERPLNLAHLEEFIEDMANGAIRFAEQHRQYNASIAPNGLSEYWSSFSLDGIVAKWGNDRLEIDLPDKV